MESNESQPSGIEQISSNSGDNNQRGRFPRREGNDSGSGGGSYNRFFKPSPVNAGEEHEVNIESMSKRGDAGVGRIQGLVIFVPNTKVGDKVKVKVTRVGRGYATAELVESKPEE
ncbi:MAG TPA: TRAM domain-containing protein [Verrucomicrobiae bacterium]|nr:TRAM domain-containing protein [Verrucomicrobiae bacterium]